MLFLPPEGAHIKKLSFKPAVATVAGQPVAKSQQGLYTGAGNDSVPDNLIGDVNLAEISIEGILAKARDQWYLL